MKALNKLLLLTGLALSTPLLAQEVNYTTLNWPPYIGETEDRQGVLAEIVKQTMAQSGSDYTLEFTSWTQALKDGESGKKDAVVGAYYSEERAEKYYFSLPIYSVFTGLVKLDSIDVEFIKSYDELNSYRISKLADSVVGDTFDEHPFPHMSTFTTEKEAVTALFNKEVDFYAGTLDVAKSIAKSTGQDSAKLSIVLPPINEQEVFVMFSKNTANGLELRDAFNKALMSLQASGEYEQIIESFK
ncbi:Bacterial extracellular solute-binding proteins, family 3 [Marinomonas aquimarina]|uniref:Bacterial extracellular solute-binding proteins, family 3 n=1 Tax=Marinomonas aquimarina TaxID=295068 RepID=A0A1A8TIS9_9GAMM|nr:transporter substrate-binding domain-containing protein [Marinomonas aquimarina]SBS32679.1 Bacterial extracellular solute-binding proteins, family 3 [Marinomonas aquimarina]